MFCVYVLGLCGFLNCRSCIWKKNSQHSQDDYRFSHVGYQDCTCRLWHPRLLHGSHVVSYFVSTFSLWLIYCGYTRPRGCLLSVYLTQKWPRVVTVTVHEQQVIKQNKTNKNLSFILVKVNYPALFCLVSRLSTGTSFMISPTTFIVYIYCSIL